MYSTKNTPINIKLVNILHLNIWVQQQENNCSFFDKIHLQGMMTSKAMGYICTI